MARTDPPPITFDSAQLSEERVQECMAWIAFKDKPELTGILTDATIRSKAYEPELLEAVQRILADRHGLAYTPTAGKRATPTIGQQMEVQRPNGEIQPFHSHKELRTAIVEGKVSRDWLIQSSKKPIGLLQKWFLALESSWLPLEVFAKNHFRLSLLYSPIESFLQYGLLVGTGVGFFLERFLLISPTSFLLPFLFPFTFILPAVLIFLVFRFFIGQKQANVFVRNMVVFAVVPIVLDGILGIVSGRFLLTGQSIKSLMIMNFLESAILLKGGIFGGPLGAILGTGVGYVRSKYFPKAPDAEPEGTRPYRIGLLYPAIFMLVTWPLSYFWLYPWFLSSLPVAVGN